MPHGSTGILVTCDSSRERRAAEEAITLIEEHYTRLAPPADAPVQQDSAAAPKDISQIIAAEVKDLKDKSKKRFSWHDTGVKGTAFVTFPNEPGAPSPTDVVLSIMRELKATKTYRTRCCNKFLPATHICYAGMDEIRAMGAEVVKGAFPAGEGVESIPFACEYDHRAADQFDRMQVINCFVDHIPKPHKVNLSNPKKTVLVQVLRNACAAAVVEEFRPLSKYNVRKIMEDEQPAAAAKPKAAPAKPEAEAGTANAEPDKPAEPEADTQVEAEDDKAKAEPEAAQAADEAKAE